MAFFHRTFFHVQQFLLRVFAPSLFCPNQIHGVVTKLDLHILTNYTILKGFFALLSFSVYVIKQRIVSNHLLQPRICKNVQSSI